MLEIGCSHIENFINNMKICYILNSIYEFRNGCFFIRIHIPAVELNRRGHKISYAILGSIEDEKKMIEENDILVFTRLYHTDPFKLLYRVKAMGKKIVYEMDDNIWTISPVNPVEPLFNQKIVQKEIEGLLEEADLVTTTTDYLANVLRKFNKNVWVCPNAIDRNIYKEREKENKELRIGWSGSVTHFDDLLLIIDVIKDLQEKYKFKFILEGITGNPLYSEMASWNFLRKRRWRSELNTFFDKALLFWEKLQKINYVHIPFYIPFLYPQVLRDLDIDIGLIPLLDSEFNRSKSCIKFYEYASLGIVTLASDVLPYNKEVNYSAKNSYKDWYKKLERLIIDKEFREKILKKQQEYVFQNRDIKVVGDKWEEAFKSLL